MADPSRTRVLLIEDHVDTAILLAEYLGISGMEAEYAHNAADGIRKAATFRPDVVVTDFRLPDMDGTGVVSRIRELAGCEGTKTICYSGDARVRAESHGFDAFVLKPGDAQEIVDAIRRLMGSPTP